MADPGDAQPEGPHATLRENEAFDAEAPEALPQREAVEREPMVLESEDGSFVDDGTIRVELDSDLAVEVSTDGQGIEVVVEGSKDAIDPLRDLGPEMENALAQSGFSHDGFHAR
jgi:hypothetical protein